MSHDNAPLSAGTETRAVDFPPAVFVTSDVPNGNISTTVYITGTPEVSARFMAPTSGRVGICLSAGLRNNSGATPNDRLFFSYQIFVGDPNDAVLFQGEEVKGGLSNRASADVNDDYSYGGHLTIVSGMEPGEFYYVQTRYRTTLGNSTADIGYRGILVFPVP